MNLRKWTAALTLCATLMMGAAPAYADNDTAYVGAGAAAPNLQAAAQAMAAATSQMAGTHAPVVNNNSAQQSTSDTQSVGIDYVSLENAAVTIDGQTYLPLRATFSAMKDQALNMEWKADGQQKLRLSNGSSSYEVYLASDDSSLMLQQGGTTYTLKNVGGVTYVSLSFFQAAVQSANISLSGDQILVLAAKDGSNVWTDGFWSNMNTYQAAVETPEVSYPDVSVDASESISQDEVDAIINSISDATRSQIVATAMQYLGVPYVYGGSDPSGFDCSGLVQYVFAQCGISLPRTSYDQQAAVQTVSLVSLQPGDLVFWGDSAYHVGIYLGDGQYIHAPAPGQSVTIQSYDSYPYTSGGVVLA